MPWTIYRYILTETLRIFAIALFVLVTVLSLALAIKPITQGLLGGWAIVRFVFYTAPTVLQFAVPFAAAFAGTMAYNRMATSNEVTACSAGGISYRSLLYPVVAMGLVLTLAMYLLSNVIVPKFYEQTERMLHKDVAQLMVAKINNHEPTLLNELMLYADGIAQTQDIARGTQSGIQPHRLIVLQRVAVAQVDRQTHVIRREATADEAHVYLFSWAGKNYATVKLKGGMWYDPAEGRLSSRELEFPPIELPDPLSDKPKFFTAARLRSLHDRPEQYDKVDAAKAELATALARVRLLDMLETSLPATVTFTSPTGRLYEVRAPNVQRRDNALQLTSDSPDRKQVRVAVVEQGSQVLEMAAAAATLVTESFDPLPEPVVRIELANVDVRNTSGGDAGTQHETYGLPRMRWRTDVFEKLLDTPALELLRDAEAEHADVPAVAAAVEAMKSRIQKLLRRAISELNARMINAISASCIVLIGAVVAMRLSDRTPLVVYLGVFALTILGILLNEAGATMTRQVEQPLMLGIALMWSNIAVLLFALAVNYRKLTRN